jgi:hypothetical protein
MIRFFQGAARIQCRAPVAERLHHLVRTFSQGAARILTNGKSETSSCLMLAMLGLAAKSRESRENEWVAEALAVRSRDFTQREV